jgi:hypothetical protein
MYDLIKVMAAALLMPLPFLFLLVGLGLASIALGWRRLGLGVSVSGLFDVSLILLSLPVLLPLLVVVALLVRVKLGAPVLFRQVRPGLAGKPFTMMKFREADCEFAKQAVSQMMRLPWGYNLKIVSKCKTREEANFYIHSALSNGWSRNVLVHQIESRMRCV